MSVRACLTPPRRDGPQGPSKPPASNYLGDSKVSRSARCRSFDFNPTDFLNDPHVLVMSFEERGAYITLLCRAWEMTIPGVLPADEGIIRRLVGATTDEWDRVRASLRGCFDTSDGRWIQKRMHREFQAQTQRVTTAEERQRRLAQQGGQQRSSKASRGLDGRFLPDNNLGLPAQPDPAPPASPLPPPASCLPTEKTEGDADAPPHTPPSQPVADK